MSLPSFSKGLSTYYPVADHCYAYDANLWMMAGSDYISYDITEVPHSGVFDALPKGAS